MVMKDSGKSASDHPANPAEAAAGERYAAHIRKVETGEVRVSEMRGLTWDAHSQWWWGEGNFSCDCNRSLEFERAAGRDGWDEAECGEGGYLVRLIGSSGDILYDEWDRTPAVPLYNPGPVETRG